MLRLCISSSALALAALSACADQAAPTQPGDRVAIAIAPLSFQNIDRVCYDIEVRNADGTVWSLGDTTITKVGGVQATHTGSGGPVDATTVCSDQYGDGAGGALTYIGTCDATSDSDGNALNGVQNAVTLWVDGIYADGGAALRVGGGAADIGAWQDPCPNGCTVQADCSANADTRVDFDLTVMRAADQGFFDVAVNFEDVFCSAKLDTCYDVASDDRIKLIFGGDGDRDWTAVVGLACTAGAGSDVATNLLYSRIDVTCNGGATRFNVDPKGAPGERSVVGTDGKVLHYAVYRGQEDLGCGAAGDCNKLYWNLALSVDDLAAAGGSCSLALSATANDGDTGFVNGVPTATGLAYPYIDMAATLTQDGAGVCQKNALGSAAVATGYHGNAMGGVEPVVVMCSEFDGSGTGTAATSDPSCDLNPAPPRFADSFDGTGVVVSPSDKWNATGGFGTFTLGGGQACQSSPGARQLFWKSPLASWTTATMTWELTLGPDAFLMQSIGFGSEFVAATVTSIGATQSRLELWDNRQASSRLLTADF
ncbi:MAG: hypothetical protein U1F43_32565 [Myxococcota bacterium]